MASIGSTAIGFRPSSPLAPPSKITAKIDESEGFTFNQVFYLSKNPDGTPRTRVIPITVKGPQASMAEVSKEHLFQTLDASSKENKVTAVYLRSLTMKFADGRIAKLDLTIPEIKHSVDMLRKVYDDHLADENGNPITWSSYSEYGRGDENGARCLDYSTSTRASLMTQWPREKIVKKLNVDVAAEERSKKVDEFFTRMLRSIDEKIRELSEKDPKEDERIQRLHVLKAGLERSRAAVTAAASLSSEIDKIDEDLKKLQEAFKTEAGARKEGIQGYLLRQTDNDLTDGEHEFLFDIALLRARTGDEYVSASTKQKHLPKQDCFESAIYNVLFDSGLIEDRVTEEKAKEAIESESFCKHPSIKGLLSGEDLEDFKVDFYLALGILPSTPDEEDDELVTEGSGLEEPKLEPITDDEAGALDREDSSHSLGLSSFPRLDKLSKDIGASGKEVFSALHNLVTDFASFVSHKKEHLRDSEKERLKELDAPREIKERPKHSPFEHPNERADLDPLE